MQDFVQHSSPGILSPCLIICMTDKAACDGRQENEVAIDVIMEHIRMKLQQPELHGYTTTKRSWLPSSGLY